MPLVQERNVAVWPFDYLVSDSAIRECITAPEAPQGHRFVRMLARADKSAVNKPADGVCVFFR